MNLQLGLPPAQDVLGPSWILVICPGKTTFNQGHGMFLSNRPKQTFGTVSLGPVFSVNDWAARILWD